MTENLWGDLPKVESVRTPKQILLEQAVVLRDMTAGKLIGKVVDRTSGANFHLNFLIVAPTLNSYSFDVLTVVHTIHLYPATVMAVGRSNAVCDDEKSFINAVADVLGGALVKQNIAGLLAHINASADPEQK